MGSETGVMRGLDTVVRKGRCVFKLVGTSMLFSYNAM